MSRAISYNARQQVQASEIQEAILVVLDIEHPSLDSTIRVVNNTQDVEWDGNTYLASSFKFTPPSQEDSEVSNAKLTISNIDRKLVELIRSISSMPTITVNIVFAGSSVEREAGPWIFDLIDVSYTAQTITGSLSFNFKPKETVSRTRVTLRDFPCLIQVQ